MVEKRTLRKLSDLVDKPATEKPLPGFDLTIRHGWNFGLGFSAAMLVFSVVIVPTIFCIVTVLLMAFGSIITGLAGL